MAVLSVVWGVSAFGGPLYGGLVQTLLSWRWAFLLFAAAAVVFAIACVRFLRNEPERPSDGRRPRNFPALALTCLALGITAIAAAGVETRPWFPLALVLAGLAGIAIFFVLDASQQNLPPVSDRTFRSPDSRGLRHVDGGGTLRVDLLLRLLRPAAARLAP